MRDLHGHLYLAFPWFRKWDLEFTLDVNLKEWCWSDHKHSSGCFNDEDSIAKLLGMKSNTRWFCSDFSILCFTFILEGLK